MLSFFTSRRNWNSPTPLAAGECAPPPPYGRGVGHTRLRERGWGSPNSDEGKYTVVLCMYKYFVDNSQDCAQKPQQNCTFMNSLKRLPSRWHFNPPGLYSYCPQRLYHPHRRHSRIHSWGPSFYFLITGVFGPLLYMSNVQLIYSIQCRSGFFHESVSPKPLSIPFGPFFRKFLEIFAAQVAPPVSLTPVANGKNLQL